MIFDKSILECQRMNGKMFWNIKGCNATLKQISGYIMVNWGFTLQRWSDGKPNIA